MSPSPTRLGGWLSSSVTPLPPPCPHLSGSVAEIPPLRLITPWVSGQLWRLPVWDLVRLMFEHTSPRQPALPGSAVVWPCSCAPGPWAQLFCVWM